MNNNYINPKKPKNGRRVTIKQVLGTKQTWSTNRYGQRVVNR